MISALKSGKYDVNQTALFNHSKPVGDVELLITSDFLRKALQDAGLEQVPVISLSAQGFEKNEGFKISYPLLNRAMQAFSIWGFINESPISNTAL